MKISRFCSPYCLKRLKDGRYIVLNRKYKPIGFTTNERVVYEDYPIGYSIKGITSDTARTLSWNGSDNREVIYLYSDDTATRGRSYIERLVRLASYGFDFIAPKGVKGK